MSEEQLDRALDLLRRLPPQNIENNLAALLDLQPDLTDDLLSQVDRPLKVALDKEYNKQYILCDYNSDGESYRSPWSNSYDPPLADGVEPSPEVRELEITANQAFDTYRELYYEGGVSSCYFWDTDDGFAAAIMIKKTGDGVRGVHGCWDAIHVIDVIDKKNIATYKMTSTIMLWMKTTNDASGVMDLGGNMTKITEETIPINSIKTHIANIGGMVEDVEIRMRHGLNDVYFGKTKDIVNDLRSVATLSDVEQKRILQESIASQVSGRPPSA
eukprot:CFRG2082T1